MNITKKLLLTFTLLILSLIVTNVISIFSLSKIGNNTDYFQSNTLPSLDAMNKESLKVLSIRSRLYLHGLTEDQGGMDAIKQEAIKLYDEVYAMHQHYIKDLAADPRDLELSKKTLADLEAFRPVMAQYFKISESNDRGAIIATMHQGGMVAGKIADLINDFADQVAYNSSLVDKANQESSSLIHRSMLISGSATILATIVLGIFGLLTVLNVKNRLNAMKDGMVAISENLDLSHNLTSGRQDEIGMAVSAFNSLISRYRDWETDRKSTRLNSSHLKLSRMPSSA